MHRDNEREDEDHDADDEDFHFHLLVRYPCRQTGDTGIVSRNEGFVKGVQARNRTAYATLFRRPLYH